jgi:hypothetical protein
MEGNKLLGTPPLSWGTLRVATTSTEYVGCYPELDVGSRPNADKSTSDDPR